MNKNWPYDLKMMHRKFGVPEVVEKMTPGQLKEFMHFRIACCQEEINELVEAYLAENPEEIVDALIDMCVFAIGTLDAFGVDGQQAWDNVYAANMAKDTGVNKSRPNKFGFPDLIKPEGWVAPSHEGNHGKIGSIFKNE